MQQRSDTPSVLVVEDDHAVRSLIATTVREAGCDAMTAQHGAEALALLDHHPDVIVLDLVMPVMDGTAFYEAMQRRGQSVPTILLSSDPGVSRVARQLGAPRAMTKPCNLDELTRAVYELYENEKSALR